MRRAAPLAPLLLAIVVTPAAGSPTPDWLTQAIGRPAATAVGARVDAVILHDELSVEVPGRGRTVYTTRHAVRIATKAGVSAATGIVGYIRGSTDVRAFHAWVIGADGKIVKQWDRKDAVDASAVGWGELYNECRHLEVTAEAIVPGQVFAYQATLEEDPLFAQWQWDFRDRYPCALSRFTLSLPPGVEVSIRSAQVDPGVARHEGRVWAWEMRDQPAVRSDPLMPKRSDLEPFVCVQALPASGEESPAGLAFRDWPSVSRWIDSIARSQTTVTPEISARAGQVTAADRDTLARIVSLARYVQSLNYASVSLNLGRGWGYRPHDATTVMRAGYGDCKDKANLLCTLLRSIGNEAWLLTVFSSDRDRIDSAWASPGQFDHCIVAIRSPSSYRGPALADRGGRLIAFDPTDPLTVFGDLPRDEQGAWGLLVRSTDGGLVRLPVQSVECNRLIRHVEAVLDAEGRLSATLQETSIGQAARDEREFRRAGGRSVYQRELEAWLSAQGGSVQIRSWSSEEDSSNGRYGLRVEYDSPTFAHAVGGRLLTFRLQLSRRIPPLSADTTRTTPIALPGQCLVETLSVQLPDGFEVDERPEDLHEGNDLGHLDLTWALENRTLVVARRWELRPVTVGPERWSDVSTLFGALRRSSEETVVLARP